jgi:predicted membrane protein
MTSRSRAAIQALCLVALGLLLVGIFPWAARFAEMAARELRYLWWLVVMIGVGAWLIWGIGRKPKE